MKYLACCLIGGVAGAFIWSFYEQNAHEAGQNTNEHNIVVEWSALNGATTSKKSQQSGELFHGKILNVPFAATDGIIGQVKLSYIKKLESEKLEGPFAETSIRFDVFVYNQIVYYTRVLDSSDSLDLKRGLQPEWVPVFELSSPPSFPSNPEEITSVDIDHSDYENENLLEAAADQISRTEFVVK